MLVATRPHGSRTRDIPIGISNLLYPNEGESPADPYDPRISHQISQYLRPPENSDLA
jgi:hypothetical protein